MTHKFSPLLWQVPLTVLLCVAASLVVATAVSSILDFAPVNPSLVGVLSAALSAVTIAIQLRRSGGNVKTLTT